MCSVMNLNIYHRLLTYGYVSADEYDIPRQRFIRYISNIRYMLADFFIYDIDIVYDASNKRYVLIKTA